MILVERHIFTDQHEYFKEMSKICRLSKNLYNSCIYNQRLQYEKDKTYISWITLINKFVKENQVDYRALPTKVSKQTIRMLDKNYQSFFSKIKNGDLKARPPKYLDSKNGKYVTSYPKDAISFKKKEGYIHLSQTKIFIKSKLSKEEVQFARVVPRGNHFVVEIGYESFEEEIKRDDGRYAAIDLGINNLATITSNVLNPTIINGKPIKSINSFYNKSIAKAKSKLPTGIYTSKYINNLYRRRDNKITNYFHKASTYIVNQLVSNQINTLVIGYNCGWKQDINMGKRNNQNFAYIPFLKLINMLTYKCELKGITVFTNEESYTSKCSFLDNEEVCKHKTYLGKRTSRGMFISSDGTKINADINGSLNILKKYLISEGTWESSIYEDLVRVCRTPILCIKNF